MTITLKHITTTTTTVEKPGEDTTQVSTVRAVWHLADLGTLKGSRYYLGSRDEEFLPDRLVIQATTGRGHYKDGVTIDGRIFLKGGERGQRQALADFGLSHREAMPEWAWPMLADILGRAAELEG